MKRVKGKREKACFKLNIKKQKQKTLRSWHLAPSLQIEGEKVEAVSDFLFLGSKITADDDCGHDIRRQLLLGRKTITNLDSVLKSKDITLLTKVHTVKTIAFSVVMYSCKSWTEKNVKP